jgi:hypothetical protein
MRTPSERELLGLWESGQTRHLIDRALLLCAWARPDVAPDQLARLPLGTVNEGLLRLRRALFGPRLQARVVCEHCGESLELVLDVADLLPAAPLAAATELQLEGLRLRLPDSTDLAAVTSAASVQAAADQLLDRCCLERPTGAELSTHLRERAEAWLETADPLADLRLQLNCDACGHVWPAALDPATWLWDEVQRAARNLLEQVHVLARAYGWTESQVLALSPQRRAVYLEMVAS